MDVSRTEIPGPKDTEMTGPKDTEMPSPKDTEMPGPKDTEMPGPKDTEMLGPKDTAVHLDVVLKMSTFEDLLELAGTRGPWNILAFLMCCLSQCLIKKNNIYIQSSEVDIMLCVLEYTF